MAVIRGPLLGVILLSLAAMCAAGCGRPSAADVARTLASWAATAHLVAEEWERGTIPAVYARQCLETAETEARAALRRATAGGQRLGALTGAADRIPAGLGALGQAIRRGDRVAAAEQAAALAAEAGRLRAAGRAERPA